MAKRATAKAQGSSRKAAGNGARSSRSGSGGSTSIARSSGSRERSGSDPVGALVKLLQNPLVIELLAVGATAALAAITEHRSSRAQGGETSGKAMKAAGKAAAAAIGRRLASEFEEIRSTAKAAAQSRSD